MAITRRQFVTRLGTLAAALGVSQVDLAKVTEAFAHGGAAGAWAGGAWTLKPKVIWVHGAECTGCSTSLLSLFEDATGKAVEGTSITTLMALDLSVGGDGTNERVTPANGDGLTGHPYGHRTLNNSASVTGSDFDNSGNSTTVAVNIADVLIDFIDLQYHETVMGMGGELAYSVLHDNMHNADHANAKPYVLVVEGAVQDKAQTGYWNETNTTYPWCSIGMNDAGTDELSFDDVVLDLTNKTNCKAVIAIGQCAAFGGYPAAVSPTLGASMTGAQSVYDFLVAHETAGELSGKVINVPGCPTNPWWFILTVVLWLIDATSLLAGGSSVVGVLTTGLAIDPAAVDSTRRLKKVYGTSVHGPMCPRYQDFVNGRFATRPGATGCLQLVGCKGPRTNSLCGLHGWNGQQPHNNTTWDQSIAAFNQNGRYNRGGFCVSAGAPCMGCTEKGYPDSFVPFVVR